jgi:hypothetical protein
MRYKLLVQVEKVNKEDLNEQELYESEIDADGVWQALIRLHCQMPKAINVYAIVDELGNHYHETGFVAAKPSK